MGWPKSREPGPTVKNRPRNPSSTRKSRNAKMTQKCRTGESHGTLGQKFSKKVFEKFRKEVVRSSGSYHSPVRGRQQKKSGTPHQHALLYTGAKFFYLQEARKIYSTLHTGANCSIFVREKLEKFKKSSKWASWRSKSQNC